jgi:Holliday junction resolvase RusA-like endonuclease
MKINLPMVIHIPRIKSADKAFWLNLNVYRNSHRMVLHQAKKIYAEHVWGSVLEAGLHPERLKLTPPLRMVYTLHTKDRRKYDIGNVLSIVQKFTDDALVDLGFIADDDYDHIAEVVYRFGGIDKKNPRVVLEIHEYRGETDTDRQGRFDFAD